LCQLPFTGLYPPCSFTYAYYYYYRYSALGPVWAETRSKSGDWYGSGTLHPGQILRGSLPLLSPICIYRYVIFIASHLHCIYGPSLCILLPL
jgi:hypothetical protein